MVDGKRAMAALVVGLVLGATGFGLAIAQQGDTPAGEISVRRQANVLPQEQLDEANDIIQRGEQISRRVMGMLDEARRERDIIRVTCLNDKLTQINADRRTAGDRLRRLNEADEIGDTERAAHEYTMLTILSQNFSNNEAASNACLGQDTFETGTTRVVTDIDPETPEEGLELPEPAPPAIPTIPPPDTVPM